jgi:hypothetical protein
MSILVIHITNNPLSLENIENYCNSNQKINYIISYHPLSPKTSESGEKFIHRLKKLVEEIKLNIDNISAIFIYSDENEEENTKNIMLFSIIYISQVFQYIYALFLPKKVKISDEALQLTASINKYKPVVYKRFLNIQVSEKETKIKRKIVDDYEILYVPSVYFKLKNDKLTCQWWFSYLINVFSGCGKGRLLQVSGTCYLNALMNGLLLSPHLGKMMLMYMNKKLNSLSISDKKEFEEFLNKDIISCSSGIPTPNYFFQILYNVMCKKLSLTEVLKNKEYKDLIVEFSKIYSANKDTGQGGLFDAFFKLINDIIGKKVFLSEDFDIAIIRENVMEKIKDIKGKNPIEFSFIELYTKKEEIEFLEDETSRLRHAVCGFVCKDEYYIYDSATNLIYNFDWTKQKELLEFLKIFNIFFTRSTDKIIFKNIKIEAVMLSNVKKWELYEKLGVCPNLES